jgi:hypothetical protein
MRAEIVRTRRTGLQRRVPITTALAMWYEFADALGRSLAWMVRVANFSPEQLVRALMMQQAAAQDDTQRQAPQKRKDDARGMGASLPANECARPRSCVRGRDAAHH